MLTICAEWKGRDDGLIAHVFFVGGPNFTLAMFAIAVEGYAFLKVSSWPITNTTASQLDLLQRCQQHCPSDHSQCWIRDNGLESRSEVTCICHGNFELRSADSVR
jgi:hypothetical protein